MTHRRVFNTSEREAILHLRVLELEGRPIPLEIQKTLTAKQINDWYDADHFPHRWTDGGPTEPWNGQMLLNADGEAFLQKIGLTAHNEHGTKTAKIDIPQIAKAKRLTPKNEAFRRKMLSKSGQTPDEPKTPSKPKKRWGSQPMAGSKNSGWKKPINGPAVRRQP